MENKLGSEAINEAVQETTFCPKCCAVPGESCFNDSTDIYYPPHIARYNHWVDNDRPHSMMENEDYKKSNREKRMTPKRGLFWCEFCDRDMVSNGSRCETCGKQEGSKRLKKDTSAR